MAQKFYLANAAPTQTVPIGLAGVWSQTTNSIQRLLALEPTGSNTSLAISETVSTDPYNVRVLRFCSPAIVRDGSLSGTVRAVFARFANTSTTTDYVVTRMTVFGVQVDPVVPANSIGRGGASFTSPTGDPSHRWPLAVTAVDFNNVMPETIDLFAGDQIVVEVGYQARNATSSTRTGTVQYGGTSGTDLALGDTGTDATTLPSWVVFDDLEDLFTEFEEVDGTAQALLGTLTASALGEVTAEIVPGTGQATLGALSASASGDRSTSGTASAVLGALIAQALGTVTAEVVPGQAQAQLGALTSTATAGVAVTATAQAGLGQLVAQANATGEVTGTSQAVLGALVAAADGTVTAEVVTGQAVALLGSLVAAASASGSSSGTAQAVLGALTVQATGEVTAEVVSGTASAQLGPLTAQATGSGLVPTITGTAQAQLGGLTAQALADVLVPALAAAQLGALLASTSGRRTRHALAQAVLGPLVAAVAITPPVTYAEMRPATVLAPATTGAVRSGPTMRSA